MGASFIPKTASQLKNVPAGNIAATNVQAALNELDTEKAPLASPTFTGVVTVPTPSNASDAATKGYADAVATGLDVKASVRAATTANVVLATGLVNLTIIDGVTLATDDRVLVKEQTAGAENGIYVVPASGVAGRAADADVSAEVTAGMFTFVTEGTANGDKGFVLVTNDPITLGTTALVFSQFSGGGGITSVTGTAPIASSGGATPAISLNDDGVTYAKIQNVSAADKVLGRATAGAGDVEEIACTSGGRNLLALALGSADDKLFVNASGTNVEYAKGFYLLSTTRDMTTDSGNVSYTGVGFKPSTLIVMSTINDLADVFSFTFVTAALTRGFGQVGTSPVMVATGNGVMLQLDAGVYQSAVLSSYDSDGITLTWTKSGSPTGTGYIYILCLR